ncbi:ATP-binding protein [Streptomyces sp. SID3343]|uniref:SCO6881 family protein n=1 Tax=Streptomyces sp. SID3343 TaxID=2690260 RepID=UPI00136B2847|nr:ATP-binding protein [Streptomyces sp. SID3343]MYW03367.1 ATP-binding protein [Streptomyces sp. SID3343]MYW06227.1 ATP-binding protein [Streptomyces sp. SID3343]
MGVCNVPLVDKVCDAVGGVVSSTGAAITDGIGAWMAKSMGELAASAADLAARAVDNTTRVDLNASWFRDNYALLLPIGLVMIVGTFCAQLIRAAFRRDEQALAQAVTGTVIGVMFQFGAIAFTSVALTVVDALSAGLFDAADSSIEASIRRIVQVSSFGSMYPLGWAVAALVALGCAVACFLYWGVMVFRKVSILIMVTLAVFAGAGGGWEAARRWRRGWIEATATLVVSKLLMTVVFVLGVAAMGKSDSSDGLAALSDVMAGIVVMAIVLCCPMITYKFIHWAGEGGNGQDLHGSASAGLSTAAAAAQKAGGMAMGGGAKGGAPQGPLKFPGMGKDGVLGGIDPSGGGGDGGGGGGGPTQFKFGEDPSASGDKGQPLIKRPQSDGDQGQPLIRRAGEPGPSVTAPESGSSAAPDSTPAPTGGVSASTSAGTAAPAPESGSTPPATGGSTPATAPVRSGAPSRPAPTGSGSSAPAPAPGSAPRAGGTTPSPATGSGRPAPINPAVAPGAGRTGPSPQGSATPNRWVYPNKPPTGD